MNILIVHGSFLEGSGLNSYVCNLAKEIKKNGHRVIIISQENKIIDYSLIDCICEFSYENKNKRIIYKSNVNSTGNCILVKPELYGVLPMHKKEDIKEYKTFNIYEMDNYQINNYTKTMKDAIENILEEVRIDYIISTHLFPESTAVELIRTKYPYIKHCCVIDGESINYSFSNNKKLRKFITPVLLGAQSLIFLNKDNIKKLTDEFPGFTELIKLKSNYIPPGVDTKSFKLIDNEFEKRVILENLRYKLKNENEDITFLNDVNGEEKLNILSYGDFSLEKGIPLLILLYPFIKGKIPNVELYISYSRIEEERYKALIRFLSEGLKEEFYDLLDSIVIEFNESNYKNNLYEVFQYNIKDPAFAETYFKLARGISKNIKFVGNIGQNKLADLINLMDLCVFPIIIEKGFPTSGIEAISSGVPVVLTSNSSFFKIDKIIRDIYQDEFNIYDYKEVCNQDTFLDNLIFNISTLLSFIKDNKNNGKTIKLKRRISEIISEENLWSYTYEEIKKTSSFNLY